MKLVIFQPWKVAMKITEYQGILGSTPASAGSGGTSEYGKLKWNWPVQNQLSTTVTVHYIPCVPLS
jgi:hypothetical protein